MKNIKKLYYKLLLKKFKRLTSYDPVLDVYTYRGSICVIENNELCFFLFKDIDYYRYLTKKVNYFDLRKKLNYTYRISQRIKDMLEYYYVYKITPNV